MTRVGIVTDSTNCLPPEKIKEYDIKVAPFQLILERKSYKDKVDITPAEFWKMFKTLKTTPTTGTVTPAEFVGLFGELAKSTDVIVCIVVSQALTGAYKTAIAAREIALEEHPELKIEIIDSKTSVGALGFIVLEAARAAQSGKSFNEVIQMSREMVSKVKYFATFDSLKYLIRSGRAPKTAVLGDLAGVKPIVGLVSDTGLVDSLGKEMGKKKAMAKIIEMIKDYTDTSKPLHVMIHFTDNIKDGEKLKELVTSRYNCTEVYLTDLTPVMATHTGPMIALSFYS
jgi:DegV family protein with EDD domain